MWHFIKIESNNGYTCVLRLSTVTNLIHLPWLLFVWKATYSGSNIVHRSFWESDYLKNMFMVSCEQSSEKKSIMKMVNTAILINAVWEEREDVRINSHSCIMFYKWKKGKILSTEELLRNYLAQQDALFKSSTDEYIHVSVSYEPHIDFCLHHKRSH